jgi:hypothetical protein
MATGGEPYHDIRFALMAVVPDRRTELNNKLTMLRLNRSITIDALTLLVNQVPAKNPSKTRFKQVFKQRTSILFLKQN